MQVLNLWVQHGSLIGGSAREFFAQNSGRLSVHLDFLAPIFGGQLLSFCQDGTEAPGLLKFCSSLLSGCTYKHSKAYFQFYNIFRNSLLCSYSLLNVLESSNKTLKKKLSEWKQPKIICTVIINPVFSFQKAVSTQPSLVSICFSWSLSWWDGHRAP